MLLKGKPVRKFKNKIVRVRFVIGANAVGYEGKLLHDKYNKYTVLGNSGGYCNFRASDVNFVYSGKNCPTLIAIKEGKLAK